MNKNISRGKRKDTNEWIKGCLLVEDIDKPEGRMFILERYAPGLRGKGYEVIPETVGQYTECPDMYGNDIFEDDIVVLDSEVKKIFKVNDGVVKYGRGGFYVNDFGTLNSLNVLASYDWILRGKVIGNIHDNPELLNKYK